MVNGQDHTVEKDSITYEQIVTLAFGQYEDNPNIVYTVLYFKGNPHKPKGELVKGESVKVKQGDEGYSLEVRNGYALVHDVPYINSQKKVCWRTSMQRRWVSSIRNFSFIKHSGFWEWYCCKSLIFEQTIFRI